jgi:hypothetical protein
MVTAAVRGCARTAPKLVGPWLPPRQQDLKGDEDQSHADNKCVS